MLTSSLHGNDQLNYYSDTDDEMDEDPGPSTGSNHGNKLYRKKGVRWYRRGKLGHWTETRAERELVGRISNRLHSFQHGNVEALLDTEASMPDGLGARYRPLKRRRGRSSWSGRDEYKELRGEEKISLRASTLAPTLLLPVLSARSLLESKTLKNNFRSPHITALSRTAQDLAESESILSRALGRTFASMERIFRVDSSTITTSPYSESQRKYVLESKDDMSLTAPNERQHPLPDETSNQAIDTPSIDAVSEADVNATPALSQIDNLFVSPQGLTLPVCDPNDGSSDRAGAEPQSVKISAAEQRDMVYAGLECLNDLYLDSREYMDRLEEIREMLADVRRNRSAMWDVLRTWALQRDKEDMQVAGLYRDDARHDVAQHDDARNEIVHGPSSSGRRSKKRSGRN